jgi:hypothetical protein
VHIADVNWLLSALAQSAAALVAIVGGLLVSRYVSLHAEQQAALRRLSDLVRLQRLATQDADSAQRAVDVDDADALLDDWEVLDDLVTSNGSGDLVALRTALDGGDHIPDEILAERLDDLLADLKRAAQELNELVPVAEDQDDWRDFRREHGLRPGWAVAWEYAYELVTVEKADQAKQERLRREAASPSAEGLGSLLRSVRLPPLAPPLTAAVVPSFRDRDETARLTRRRDETRARVATLDAEADLARRHIAETRQPEGFRLALLVLTYLSVVGIGVPVVIMANGPLELPVWLRTVVVAAFASGLLVLLRYLFVYAAYLDESRGRKSLPTSLWGLFSK